jgi:hypothetical protein
MTDGSPSRFHSAPQHRATQEARDWADRKAFRSQPAAHAGTLQRLASIKTATAAETSGRPLTQDPPPGIPHSVDVFSRRSSGAQRDFGDPARVLYLVDEQTVIRSTPTRNRPSKSASSSIGGRRPFRIQSLSFLAAVGTQPWPSRLERPYWPSGPPQDPPRSSWDLCGSGSTAPNGLSGGRPSTEAGPRRSAGRPRSPLLASQEWSLRGLPAAWVDRHALGLDEFLHSNRQNSSWSGSGRPSRRSGRMADVSTREAALGFVGGKARRHSALRRSDISHETTLQILAP